jgi:hypothetical protein
LIITGRKGQGTKNRKGRNNNPAKIASNDSKDADFCRGGLIPA